MNPDCLKFAVVMLEALAPDQLKYRSDATGYTSRAAVAAAHLDHVTPGRVDGLWNVQSRTTSGRVYEVSLPAFECECAGWRRSGLCWHLIGAGMAEARRRTVGIPLREWLARTEVPQMEDDEWEQDIDVLFGEVAA